MCRKDNNIIIVREHFAAQGPLQFAYCLKRHDSATEYPLPSSCTKKQLGFPWPSGAVAFWCHHESLPPEKMSWVGAEAKSSKTRKEFTTTIRATIIRCLSACGGDIANWWTQPRSMLSSPTLYPDSFLTEVYDFLQPIKYSSVVGVAT